MIAEDYIIQVLIVDDRRLFALRFASIINDFASKFDFIKYHATPIMGFDAYNKARDFIRTHESDIDIIIADYNLESVMDGTDLFKQIDTLNFQIYRILYSVTNKSLSESKDGMHLLYDDFKKRKNRDAIVDALKKYEELILDTKIFGNRAFRTPYYLSDNSLSKIAKQVAFNICHNLDIVYAEKSEKGRGWTKIYFREPDFSINEIGQEGTTIALQPFSQNGLFFRRINGSLMINLLWVADIDPFKNLITFITLGNKAVKKIYTSSDIFSEEIVPLIPQIQSLPYFFRR